MKWMLTDFKRGLVEPSFLGSMLLTLGCLIVGLWFYIQQKDSYMATEAFKASQSFILPFIAPLIAASGYSNMIMLEQDCGYNKALILGNKGRNYYFKRWWVNNTLSGFTLALPLLVWMMVCRVFSPYESGLFIIKVIALAFGFGFAYGAFAYGLTFVNRKRYIPLAAPQVLYLLLIYAFPYLGLERYYPPLSFSPWILPDMATTASIIMQLGCILLLSLVLMLGAQLYKKISKA